MAKTKADSPTVVGIFIPLKLGACLSGPRRRLLRDLDQMAYTLNCVRTGMVRTCQRWWEDHPEWSPEAIVDAAGNNYEKRGNPMVKNEPLPRIFLDDPAKPPVSSEALKASLEAVKKAKEAAAPSGGKLKRGDVKLPGADGSMLLYGAARKQAPHIAAKIVSSCVQEVLSRLKLPTPYNHHGKAHYRWQAILLSEVNGDTFSGLRIPVPVQDSAICYKGGATNELSSKVHARLLAAGKQRCVLRLPLFSVESGRRVTDGMVQLQVETLSPGHRKILQMICRSEAGWKMADSSLVFHDEGKFRGWHLHLVYRQPVRAHVLLPENVAILEALKDGDGAAPPWSKPFRIRMEDGPMWRLGDARVLEYQYRNLQMRSRTLRHRSRGDNAGRKGHGNSRFYRDVLPVGDRQRNLLRHFRVSLMAEIMKFVVTKQCAVLEYREPPRTKDWFDQRGLPFARTRFLADLRYKCKLHGVALRVAGGEVLVENAGSARAPESVGASEKR